MRCGMRNGRISAFDAGADGVAGVSILDHQAAVFGKGFKCATEKCPATGVTLYLAAGGFGNRAASYQHDCVQRQVMLIEYGHANCIQHQLQIHLPVVLDLLYQNESLTAVVIHGESGPVADFQQRVTHASRGLDILWIAIQAADDDQVFPPASDVKLAITHETQVACAQERAFTCVAQVGVEGTAGQAGVVPVPLAD